MEAQILNCDRCSTTDEEINFSERADQWLCLSCYERLGPSEPATFESLRAEGVQTKEQFDALPMQMQNEAWSNLAREIDERRERRQAETRRKLTDWRAVDRRLREVEPEAYVEQLGGIEASRYQMSRCPLPDHEDDTPSLKVYEDRKWHCFGCNRTGTIYDFAGFMWGIPTRGDGFKEIQRRLASMF